MVLIANTNGQQTQQPHASATPPSRSQHRPRSACCLASLAWALLRIFQTPPFFPRLSPFLQPLAGAAADGGASTSHKRPRSVDKSTFAAPVPAAAAAAAPPPAHASPLAAPPDCPPHDARRQVEAAVAASRGRWSPPDVTGSPRGVAVVRGKGAPRAAFAGAALRDAGRQLAGTKRPRDPKQPSSAGGPGEAARSSPAPASSPSEAVGGGAAPHGDPPGAADRRILSSDDSEDDWDDCDAPGSQGVAVSDVKEPEPGPEGDVYPAAAATPPPSHTAARTPLASAPQQPGVNYATPPAPHVPGGGAPQLPGPLDCEPIVWPDKCSTCGFAEKDCIGDVIVCERRACSRGYHTACLPPRERPVAEFVIEHGRRWCCHQCRPPAPLGAVQGGNLVFSPGAGADVPELGTQAEATDTEVILRFPFGALLTEHALADVQFPGKPAICLNGRCTTCSICTKKTRGRRPVLCVVSCAWCSASTCAACVGLPEEQDLREQGLEGHSWLCPVDAFRYWRGARNAVQECRVSAPYFELLRV